MAERGEGRPWEVGDEDARWEGYFYPGTEVLRNVRGIRDQYELQRWEGIIAAVHASTLDASAMPEGFGPQRLGAIHRHLFQDVYPWAGEVRTVTMSKGGGSPFAHPEQVDDLLSQVDQVVRDAGAYAGSTREEFLRPAAAIYNVVNVAHRAREGNGRAQRIYMDHLAAGAGYELDWTQVQGAENDHASAAARQGDHEPLLTMFDRIISTSSEPEQVWTVGQRAALRLTQPEHGRVIRPASSSPGDARPSRASDRRREQEPERYER